MKFKNKTVKIMTGLLVSGFFLGLAFHKVNIAEFWAALSQVNLSALAISVGFFSLSCLFRALMWRVTTTALGKVGFGKLFGGVVVGYLANNFLPLRAGEVVRAGYLAAASELPAVGLLSTIFVERAFDIFSLGFLLLLTLSIGSKGLERPAGEMIWLFFGALVFLFILLVGVVKVAKRVEGREATSKPLGLFLRYAREFLRPLNQLCEPRMAALLAALSLIAWASNYLSILFLLKSTGNFLFEATLLVMLFVNLGILIPSSPGALGVMQAAFWVALAPFGVPKAQSLALSFAYQGGLYLFTLSVGLPFLLASQAKWVPGGKFLKCQEVVKRNEDPLSHR
ncbi:MAG: flippase-like domain-containing protein [Armatimonadetes bacterium]|nr:flippase-like domain-containing protein [Armatimonadota bacterium]